jgi:glycerate 2-kinase
LPAADLADPDVERLVEAFETAVAAASAARCLSIPSAEPGARRMLVLGAGKAAAAMALAFNAAADADVRGLVVTRYGHGLRPGEDAGAIEVIEAGHPAPDSASLGAARRMDALLRTLEPGDTLWFLVSGGGSALLAAPLPGITLEQKRAVASRLMHSGADIREINTVRKHLSAIKGGRLAQRAHPARVCTLAISDVPGDDIADIASGPTIPDPSTQADARAVLARYACVVEPEVDRILSRPANETPKPGDPAFARDRAEIVASSKTALDAAERQLQSQGYRVIRLGDHLVGRASELGRMHAALALEAAAQRGRCAFLSGGETSVVVNDTSARGGRNLEYLGGLALALDGARDVFALAADTDGIDGNGDHAGGIVVPDILACGRERALDLAEALAANSTYDYFDRCKLLLRMGPTRTNVNDFRLILVNRD